MAKSIVGVAQTNLQVERTIDELQEEALLPVSEISVVMPDSSVELELGAVKTTKAPEGASAGAITGSVIGVLSGCSLASGPLPSRDLAPLSRQVRSWLRLVARQPGPRPEALLALLLALAFRRKRRKSMRNGSRRAVTSLPFKFKITKSPIFAETL